MRFDTVWMLPEHDAKKSEVTGGSRDVPLSKLSSPLLLSPSPSSRNSLQWDTRCSSPTVSLRGKGGEVVVVVVVWRCSPAWVRARAPCGRDIDEDEGWDGWTPCRS